MEDSLSVLHIFIELCSFFVLISERIDINDVRRLARAF